MPDRSTASNSGRASGWRRRVPNLLTMLRLVVAVVFFVVLVKSLPEASEAQRPGLANLAIYLFIVGGLTDILDGWLARRWQVVSAFGRVMDPFVDKVLVLGAFICLAALPSAMEGPLGGPIDTGIASWVALVLLARELLVTSLRGWLEGLGVPFPADPAGKAKMLLQSVAVPVCIFVAVHAGPAASSGWQGTRTALVWATVVATVLSAVPYVIRAIRVAPRSEA